MKFLARRDRAHLEWCGGGHRCQLGEHRSDPIIADLGDAGRIVLTRVLGLDGRQHVEVRITAVLADEDPRAQRQLQRLLGRLVNALAS